MHANRVARYQALPFAWPRSSPDHVADDLAQRLDVGRREVPHDAHDEPLLDGAQAK